MTPRRGKGEGSIRLRKDGRWEATLTLPGIGKRRRRSFFGKTRKEVAQKLRDALKRQDDGLPLPSERLTVKAFLKQWLDGKGNLRPESRRRYDDSIRLHINPQIGRRLLTRLTPADLQNCYTALNDLGLSGTTIALAHGVLHKALDDAARWGMTIRNVADLVDPPHRSTPEMRPLTADETARLLQAAKGDPLEAFYVLALTTGLRLGELQALRWREVELDRRRLHVTATFAGIVGGEPMFAEPKTTKSRREIHLSEMAVAALRRHRSRQIESRLQMGGLYKANDLVFENSYGRPVDGNNVRRRSFSRLLSEAELPPMRFHNLRHCAATLLMAEGVPIKVVSEMLGHADITTTLRIYSHVLPSMQEHAAGTMDRLFGGSRKVD